MSARRTGDLGELDVAAWRSRVRSARGPYLVVARVFTRASRDREAKSYQTDAMVRSAAALAFSR